MDPLVKILIVFAAMLVANRLRLHLGIALVLGGLTLVFWAGRGWDGAWGDLYYALQQAELWLLLVVTALIFEFGRHMAEERNANVLMRAARAWGGRHGRALSLMAIPAAIGLVPMPGGALFSAPLVDRAVPESEWDAAWKGAINYWFRHVWEYWWPVFPVVIVTLSMFDLEIWTFIALQLPLSLAAIVTGYWVMIRPHLSQLADHQQYEAPMTADIGRIAFPLMVVILCTLLLPGVFSRVTPELTLQTRKLLAMIFGLGLGLIPILRDSGPDAHRKFFENLLNRKAASLLGTIGGVIIFKIMLERSELLPEAGAQLVASGMPLILIIALLPFIAGLVTGIAIGFAGISFPLLAGLIATPETGLGMASTLVLGFAFGYAGMMCSPVHLCFVLTRGYFTISIQSVLRYIIPASIGPLVVAGVLYALLRGVGW